ncbi:MAG: fimbrillin family protein [Bacteroidales bacterium]|nr:fimbrillin family protein [Bacteroidales bacterium]
MDHDSNPIPILFCLGYSIDATTKAPINNVDDLEPIQIFRSDGSSDFSAHTSADFTGTVNSAGIVTPSVLQFYKQDGTETYFLAFFPQAYAISSGVANFRVTGQEDVCAAQIKNGSMYNNNTIAFGFQHLLSQIHFKVVAENAAAIAGWGTLTYITVNSPTSLDLNFTIPTDPLTANAIPMNADLPTSIGGSASQVLTTTAASAGTVMIPVGSYPPLQIKVKTSLISEKTVTTSLWYLAKGKIYTLRLTFDDNLTTINVTKE